ncbi:hypothetical protein HYDPIDRAFT_26897 [Hydnomerulius pinastri MD-312]|nr:hypothetical protein HYDPIDRAFT_26897 [Hydnomerulius pinastri MD-312]
MFGHDKFLLKEVGAPRALRGCLFSFCPLRLPAVSIMKSRNEKRTRVADQSKVPYGPGPTGNSFCAGQGHTLRTSSTFEDDTLSETSTLVDFGCETRAVVETRITTIFEESSPENRQAVYRNYLEATAPSQAMEGPDDQMLDPDDRAWDYPSPRLNYQRAKGRILSVFSRRQESSRKPAVPAENFAW